MFLSLILFSFRLVYMASGFLSNSIIFEYQCPFQFPLAPLKKKTPPQIFFIFPPNKHLPNGLYCYSLVSPIHEKSIFGATPLAFFMEAIHRQFFHQKKPQFFHEKIVPYSTPA